MPDWSAGVWGILVSSLIGVSGVITSVIALRRSDKANRHAEKANKHADEANEIARQALQVQKRQVDVSVSSEQWNRGADLNTRIPELHANRSSVRFWLENLGPYDARDVELSLTQSDKRVSLGNADRIAAGQKASFGTSIRGLIPSDTSAELEHRATYRDGNGDQITRWSVTVDPANQFANRKWTLVKADDCDHQ